jgi:ADP-ribose pyrophosphatase YjhB (NUDIX family)/ribosomal protein S18 acetylase RimI-like enzyme
MAAERMRPVCPGCGFIFYLNPIVAAGTLVERDGRVALVQRGVQPGQDLWGLPAGYVEADETAEEAAIRETLEETHLEVEIEGLLDAFSYGQRQDRGVLLVYAARALGGTLEAGDDAVAAGWFGPDELPEIAFRTHREALHKWRQARSVMYRRATLADAEVAAMLTELYPFGLSGEYAHYVSDPEQALFVAVDQGQVVGFAGMSIGQQGRIAEIEQIFVHPRYRRWGIGTRLAQTCVAYGRTWGLRAVTVQVPVANPGWTVYLSAGFLITGFTTNYYPSQTRGPESALLLTHDLASEG